VTIFAVERTLAGAEMNTGPTVIFRVLRCCFPFYLLYLSFTAKQLLTFAFPFQVQHLRWRGTAIAFVTLSALLYFSASLPIASYHMAVLLCTRR
jgi:hypothetical protein